MSDKMCYPCCDHVPSAASSPQLPVPRAAQELYLLLTFAVLTMPGYLTACVIKRHLEKREQETASPSVEASV